MTEECKCSVLVAPSLPVAVVLPPRRWLLVRQSSVGCVGRQTCCSAALSTPHQPQSCHHQLVSRVKTSGRLAIIPS